MPADMTGNGEERVARYPLSDKPRYVCPERQTPAEGRARASTAVQLF
jgi:hypothetical protein